MQAADRRTIEVVVFHVAGERYGLPAADVREVLPAATLATPPGNRPGLLGVLDLRGQAIPVIDLRPLLGLSVGPLAPTEHLIVTRADGAWIALRVDAAESLTTAAWDDGATEQVLGQWDCLQGVAHAGDALVLVLDPRRLWNRIGRAGRDTARTAAASP